MQAYRASLLYFLDNPFDSGFNPSSYVYYEDGLLIVRSGYILDIGATQELLPILPRGIPITEYENALIVPGFIDTHVHYPQIDVIASYGEQLECWLTQYVFHTERRVSNQT